uniref:Reverse transcriptase Ty1/copia-type domain-containing protein n=1 Tax=Tanacetum cinerariifolium TaxID=118510 RepID=A0A6L2MWT9_TANCI|nr:hypothetical protein [Tanacetum cinerariifolium]
MTTSSTNNSVFRSFFEKQKLTGPNFIDWYRQLRIVLSIEDKLNYLEQPIPPTPMAPEGQQVAPEILAAHAAWVKGSKEIAGLMLMSMEPEIQQNLEPFHAYEMLKELKTLFAHMGKTVNELHAMLELHEQTLNLHKSSAPTVHAIQAVFQKEVENQLGKTIKSLLSDRGGDQKNQKNKPPKAAKGSHGKGKGKMGYASNNAPLAPKPKTPPPPNKGNPARTPFSTNVVKLGTGEGIVPYSFYYPPENKVLVARNAEFLENSLIDQEASVSLEDLEVIQEEDTHPSLDTSLNHEEDDLEIDEPQSDIVPIRRSTRTRHAPDRMCLYIDAEEHELGDLEEPANYKAALFDPESEKWLNAMNVEMKSMKDNEVWVLVELPPNGKTVGSKWLFKKKTDMDGNVHIYKARLVAKGFTQTPGIDYEETFSPVSDIRAIRILIAIAAYYDYEIWQMDEKLHIFLGSRSTEIDQSD